MFRGEKTRVFWRGLIIFGLALTVLFGVIWYVFALSWWSYDFWRVWTPVIFGGVVFALIGLYMMKSGVEKENKPRTE